MKRTKEHVGLNIRIIQRAQVSKSGKSAENGEHAKNETQHANGESNKLHRGFIASLKDTFGFIENLTHDKEIFFHYRYFQLITIGNSSLNAYFYVLVILMAMPTL